MLIEFCLNKNSETKYFMHNFHLIIETIKDLYAEA